MSYSNGCRAGPMCRQSFKDLAYFVSLSLAHTARFLSLATKIFVSGDENLLCAGNTYQRFLSLATIFDIKHARYFSLSLTIDYRIMILQAIRTTIPSTCLGSISRSTWFSSLSAKKKWRIQMKDSLSDHLLPSIEV